MFGPLKVTTDYSLMKSMIKIPSLITKLKASKAPYCGISDLNLYGVMEFYNACLVNNIKPLIGLEVSLNNVSLYLYARNYQGYLGLLKIHTKLEKQELAIFDLESYQNDLNIILPFEEIDHFSEYSFPHFYLGYTTDYEKNNAYILTDQVLFAPNLKCFRKEDGMYLNMLTSIEQLEPFSLIKKENYEKNAWEYYENVTISDDKTAEFVASCNVTIPKDNNYIPHFDEAIENSFGYLKALAAKGLHKRFPDLKNTQYETRLNTELAVIGQMGFADYFLIVYDYVKYAKKNGILVGAGRGSAVGSLVSYCLGITDVDPLEYNLLFERFLNPERITMPDIDIDFEEMRREEVVLYVKRKYGASCVANIMTFGTFKSKLVLRSVGKSLEVNQKVIDSFVSFIDPKLTLQENMTNQNISYYVENNPDIRKVMLISLKLEGLKKHISTHAAGVVIANIPLDEIIPIHYNGEELLTGLSMNYLEDLGLLKMDFLSLRNLTTMANILKLIASNTTVKIDINHLNLNDSKVLEMFAKADTVGIFQFESEGIKNFLKKLRPTKFTDLIAAIALYRPGPMENIDTFIKRKDGLENVNYLHPVLEDILKETYGVIVYQEQVMQILVTVGGFSFAQADTIRRAMSKKKKEVIEKSEEAFLKGALEKGFQEEIARSIYALILKFANYGFNKSHSVSYAMIGYQMAYLKTYYPVYFIANLLNMNIDATTKTHEYMALAKKNGITLLPPDINESELTYIIKDHSLRLPFSIIKNLGIEASKNIVENRKDKPYQDFFDFVTRTYGKKMSKKTIEALITSGCLDGFGYNYQTLLANIDHAINYATLVSDLEETYLQKPTMEEKPDLTEEEKRAFEYASFGFYINNHPASKYIEISIMKLENIKKNYDHQVQCVVLIEKIKEITTKKNDRMAFVNASDETAEGNFVVFPKTMNDLTNIKVGDLVFIKGRVARRYDDYQINVNAMTKIREGVKENAK